MRKLTIALLTGAVTLTASTAVLAQQGRPGPRQDMTRAEVQEHSAEMFKRLDANGDGKLDQADRTAHEKARFDALDTDNNGALSFDEFAAARGKRDGKMAKRGGPRGDGDGPQMAMRGKRGGPGMGPREMLERADTNKDGAITLAEFQTAALAHFDAVDSNKDGTVSADERKAQHESMRAKWRDRREG